MGRAESAGRCCTHGVPWNGLLARLASRCRHSCSSGAEERSREALKNRAHVVARNTPKTVKDGETSGMVVVARLGPSLGPPSNVANAQLLMSGSKKETLQPRENALISLIYLVCAPARLHALPLESGFRLCRSRIHGFSQQHAPASGIRTLLQSRSTLACCINTTWHQHRATRAVLNECHATLTGQGAQEVGCCGSKSRSFTV